MNYIKIPLIEVDAHNLIPPWILSDHQEYNAYFIRKKIEKQLDKFLVDIPSVHLRKNKKIKNNLNGDVLYRDIKLDRSVSPVEDIVPGSDQGLNQASLFIHEKKLKYYQAKSRDPNAHAQSGLSPYIHFGQISVQKLLLDLIKISPEVRKNWVDELLTRRELAENYCFYQEKFDQYQGLPSWSRKTLEEHKVDKRAYIYSVDQLENGETHDQLWNASQRHVAMAGTMPGYLRMYWAKKILEWTAEPSQAIDIAIYLNNKYQLDGRDPNGYAGILWSIGGLHDRPWPERSVFGKVRYMSLQGCKRKFNVPEYIEYVNSKYPG
ncbi:MAG: hypothetical protein APR63_08775 [Desulfuromonas sp. SDB]|nr:MAG: hypothetical protein APR63_08775 [Desulfuromonas sp. SDB]